MYGDTGSVLVIWQGMVCELDYSTNVWRVQKWVANPEMVGKCLVCGQNSNEYHVDTGYAIDQFCGVGMDGQEKHKIDKQILLFVFEGQI